MSCYHTFPIIPGEMADGKGNTCIDFPWQVLQAETFDWTVRTLDFQQTDVMERQTRAGVAWVVCSCCRLPGNGRG